MTRLLSHARRHSVGYLALFVALGGTGYAAFDLPNHSIEPVKLNPRFTGGYVRAWVSVNASGRATASGGAVRVISDSAIAPGHYIVDWRPRPTSRCTAIGSVDLAGVNEQTAPGYVLAEAAGTRSRGEQSFVQTYNAQGQPAALPYDLELVCATPR
jgi:hypothetical protein